MVDLQEIENLVRKSIEGSKVAVRDLTGTGDHLEIEVVSDQFEGKSLLDQHKMVYDAIQISQSDDIHAAKIMTRLPEK